MNSSKIRHFSIIFRIIFLSTYCFGAEFYDNGQIKYEKNELTGKELDYFENGRKKNEITHNNNNLDRIEFWYNENGPIGYEENYTSIQSTIDEAIEGDTVIVYNGIYFDNLDINKSITLTSLAIYDDVETWYEYDPAMGQYAITNTNILNSIIN